MFRRQARQWATHTPKEEGFDAVKLKAAVDFAMAHEWKLSPELDGVIDQRDQRITIPLQFAREPFSDPIGPLKPHAPANGIIIRHGYIVAEWGRPNDVDMTFSVTKTFLSSVAGVAFDKGMIENVNDRVIDYVRPTPDFMLPHNQPITWDKMLRQDQRLDRHHVGQALVGGPARPGSPGANWPRVRRRSARNGNIPTCA